MKFLPLLSLSAILLLSSGCLHNYRLGSTLPPNIQSVYVPIAVNTTEEPLLEQDVTSAVLAQLQRDGSLRIEREETADTQLTVTIIRHTLQPLEYGDDDRVRPEEYRLTLQAQVELVEQSSGKTIVRSGVLQGRGDVQFSGDLTSAKRLALPEAADDLARRVVSAVTEAWPDEQEEPEETP